MKRLLRRPSPWLPPAALLVLGLALPPSLTAQAPRRDPLAAFREGTHIFRRILHEAELEPLYQFAQLDDPVNGHSPEQTLLVVLGKADCLAQIPGELSGYLRRGGAVLVASDEAISDTAAVKALETEAGVHIDGESLICLSRKASVLYKDLGYCPFLRPVPNQTPALFDGPGRTIRQKLQVATNLPSFLQETGRFPPGLHPLAYLPAGCFPEQVDLTAPLVRERLFAVGGRMRVRAGEEEVKKGQVLVLADHSIFINEMMLPRDNDNVEFTYNCLEWLRDGAGTRRKYVLFVEEGRIETRLDIPLKMKLVPRMPGLSEGASLLAQAADDFIHDEEEKDGFNEAVLGWLDDLSPHAQDRLARGAVLGLTLLLLLYGCYRLGVRGRYRLEPAVPALEVALRPLSPDAPLVEQRRQALFRSGNLWEPAHLLAVQYFTAAGVPGGPRPPRVRVRGGWWQRWKMRRRVRRLWRLAYDPTPRPVSLARLRRVLRQLDELKAALADGTVRLEEPPA